MRKYVADAIDWYLDKLNKAHMLPTNAATLFRSISAKQIGGDDFRPRPLTIDNFTDAELDAIHRISFDKDSGRYKPSIGYKDYSMHGVDDEPNSPSIKGLTEYFSPLRSVQTTIGQASINGEGDNAVLNDVYDFNRSKLKIYKHPDGTVSYRAVDGKIYRKTIEELAKIERGGGTYGMIRTNAASLGHNDSDPDQAKIHTSLSMKDIKDRLGSKLGTYNISKPMSKGEFALRTAGAGALVGAPIGAVLGAVSGAVSLIDKKKRKHWVKTMLSNILGGAALSAAAGGAGAGLASAGLMTGFRKPWSGPASKTASAPEEPMAAGETKEQDEAESESRWARILSYVVPAMAVAGAGGLAAAKLLRAPKTMDDFKDKKFQKVHMMSQL